MAKVPQTDWTRGGHDISQTSVPLYQESLNTLGDILRDQTAYRQGLIDQYYGADTARNQDFLRAYNRAMGNTTANNWAATTGGYTSSGNKSYTDRQRYYNDLAARLQDYGVQSANTLMNTDVNNLLNANTSYNNAYRLGQPYSQVEQQNALADQANRNWLGNAIQLGGTAIGAAFGQPQLGAAIGGAIGSGLQTDTSQAMAAIYGGAPQQWASSGTGQFINPYQAINDVDWGGISNKVSNWWNKRGTPTGTAPTP